MKDPADVLMGVSTLLYKTTHITGADARNEAGAPVMSNDPSAVGYSLTGALLKVGNAASGTVFLDALFALCKGVGVVALDERREWGWDVAPTLTRELCLLLWEWEEDPARTPKHIFNALAMAREALAQ